MNLALPVSTYLAFSAGQISSWKAAQWLQVIEAYSMIVDRRAAGEPSTMSGSGPGCISAAATVASEAAAAGAAAATSATSPAGARRAAARRSHVIAISLGSRPAARQRGAQRGGKIAADPPPATHPGGQWVSLNFRSWPRNEPASREGARGEG